MGRMLTRCGGRNQMLLHLFKLFFSVWSIKTSHAQSWKMFNSNHVFIQNITVIHILDVLLCIFFKLYVFISL